MEENNLNLNINLDIDKVKNNQIPFINFGIIVDSEKVIEKLSELTDSDLKNLMITLKIVNSALENEYLIREQVKEDVRKEIEDLINTTWFIFN